MELVPTQTAWLTQALAHLDVLLLDHAHCEKKAARVALQLMHRYPAHRELVQDLIPLAQEELQHYDWVNRRLDQRGIRWGNLAAAPYGSRLQQLIRRQEPAQLLDSLLVCGLIEARSHERLGLLAAAVDDADLRELYQRLTQAEERHQRLYWTLALTYFPEVVVQTRWAELVPAEAEILRTLYPQPRMHS
ncbi:tRNA-(ms[2]io[6]A)-hydroxylase [Candidatus Cyanaurora vandensis]|uniref:tRNA-(ms[2]io[6]A)-hydroxylase n=1 Tax=Candidatus Cyanaurora vandensis TaxID=2714958 RepID=UPI00257991BC|nr:tRNA-(ms[2]io[6]A)-hydroxylase [Candidatus Cyanaurora vandensis]